MTPSIAQGINGRGLAQLEKRLAPTRASERIIEVDIVRGIALFGIVLVNFNSPTLSGVVIHNHADRLVSTVIAMFFNGKFYPLFSLLFGFGMAIQMLKARARGEQFSRFQLRRLAVLFGLGVANAVLVWKGDILHVYAFWGLCLLLFRGVSNRSLLPIAVLLIAVVGFQKPLNDALHISKPGDATVQRRQIATYTSPNYAHMVSVRTEKLIRDSADPKTYIGMVDILGMFLLGLYGGRRGLFQNSARNTVLIRRVMWAALAIGLVGLGWGSAIKRLSWIAGDGEVLAGVLHFLSNPTVTAIGTLYHQHALAVFYGCFLLVLLQQRRWLSLLRPFSGVGRMALTNYLTQCFVASILFNAYGLGLYGKTGAFAGTALAVGLYSLQIPLSVWWLRRFRFGPMEWFWRSLSYGRTQPMRSNLIQC